MEKTIEKSRLKLAPLVAVVDDDESIREALQSLLKSIGFRAEVFASASEFLNAGKTSEIDCLILDVRMPDVSGLKLQQRIVAGNNPIPIVFISAHSERDEKEQALDAGAIDFLYKPFGEDALLGAVERAIKSKNNLKK